HHFPSFIYNPSEPPITIFTGDISSFLAPTIRMASETQRAPMLPNSFFKVILRTNLQTVKIPNMFTAKYGDDLPNPFFMNLPNQTQWKVIWENENGEIWLKEGWNEFTEHHSLDHGDLVLFEYLLPSIHFP
ncbi:hypothetical protein V8G54_010802, partial [Vigna mungo]